VFSRWRAREPESLEGPLDPGARRAAVPAWGPWRLCPNLCGTAPSPRRARTTTTAAATGGWSSRANARATATPWRLPTT